MILHVWERAVAANLGAVVVATDSQEITDLIVQAGAIMINTIITNYLVVVK